MQLASILKNNAIEVDVCSCVQEAIEKWAVEDYEFVCTSLELNEGSGLELASRLRQMKPDATTSIYLITSNKDVYRNRSWIDSGITDAFYKSDIERFNMELHSLAKLQVKKTNSGKVLYVEDGRAESMRIIMILENMGLQVVHFDNAETAWDKFLAEGDYELVITDLLLSGLMTGLSLVRCIRSVNENTEINESWVPILGVSGFDDVSRRVDLYNAGIDDYVAKPIIETEFMARVFNLLSMKKLFTKVATQQAELEKHASIDLLTGCLNRRSFLTIAEKYISQARRDKYSMSLFYLDLDYFKKINDTYGHAEGDIVLSQMGSLLKNYCREADIVSRFGGEEFVLLFSKCDANAAYSFADKLLIKIRQLREDDLKITASIGVSIFDPNITMNIDTLINSADEVLMQAKREGRNKVVINSKNDLPKIVSLKDTG